MVLYMFLTRCKWRRSGTVPKTIAVCEYDIRQICEICGTWYTLISLFIAKNLYDRLLVHYTAYAQRMTYATQTLNCSDTHSHHARVSRGCSTRLARRQARKLVS